MASVTDILFGKKPKPDDDELQPGELKAAGIEIQRGDPRLTTGVTLSTLSADERRRIIELRQK